jgi:hypothetical protein
MFVADRRVGSVHGETPAPVMSRSSQGDCCVMASAFAQGLQTLAARLPACSSSMTLTLNMRCEETIQAVAVVCTTSNKLRTGLVNGMLRQIDVDCVFVLQNSKDSTDRPDGNVFFQVDQMSKKQETFTRVSNNLAYLEEQIDTTKLPFGLHLHRERAMELFAEYFLPMKAQQQAFLKQMPPVVCTVHMLRKQPQEKPAPAGMKNSKLQLVIYDEVESVNIRELAGLIAVFDMYLGRSIPAPLEMIGSPLHG